MWSAAEDNLISDGISDLEKIAKEQEEFLRQLEIPVKHEKTVVPTTNNLIDIDQDEEDVIFDNFAQLEKQVNGTETICQIGLNTAGEEFSILLKELEELQTAENGGRVEEEMKPESGASNENENSLLMKAPKGKTKDILEINPDLPKIRAQQIRNWLEFEKSESSRSRESSPPQDFELDSLTMHHFPANEDRTVALLDSEGVQRRVRFLTDSQGNILISVFLTNEDGEEKESEQKVIQAARFENGDFPDGMNFPDIEGQLAAALVHQQKPKNPVTLMDTEDILKELGVEKDEDEEAGMVVENADVLEKAVAVSPPVDSSSSSIHQIIMVQVTTNESNDADIASSSPNQEEEELEVLIDSEDTMSSCSSTIEMKCKEEAFFKKSEKIVEELEKKKISEVEMQGPNQYPTPTSNGKGEEPQKKLKVELQHAAKNQLDHEGIFPTRKDFPSPKVSAVQYEFKSKVAPTFTKVDVDSGTKRLAQKFQVEDHRDPLPIQKNGPSQHFFQLVDLKNNNNVLNLQVPIDAAAAVAAAAAPIPPAPQTNKLHPQPQPHKPLETEQPDSLCIQEEPISAVRDTIAKWEQFTKKQRQQVESGVESRINLAMKGLGKLILPTYCPPTALTTPMKTGGALSKSVQQKNVLNIGGGGDEKERKFPRLKATPSSPHSTFPPSNCNGNSPGWANYAKELNEKLLERAEEEESIYAGSFNSSFFNTSLLKSYPKPSSKGEIVNWLKEGEIHRSGILLSYGQNNHHLASVQQVVTPSPIVVSWFFGLITRQQAEEALLGQPTGTFLVRISTRIWGYTLSYQSNNKTKHFLISAINPSVPATLRADNNGVVGKQHFLYPFSPGGRYALVGTNSTPYTTLTSLIRHHTHAPITKAGGEKLLFPAVGGPKITGVEYAFK